MLNIQIFSDIRNKCEREPELSSDVDFDVYNWATVTREILASFTFVLRQRAAFLVAGLKRASLLQEVPAFPYPPPRPQHLEKECSACLIS